MQASDKEALPLFGTLGRGEGGKGIDCDVARERESPLLPVLDSSDPGASQPAALGIRGASGTAEPRDKGPPSYKAITTEIKAWCDDN